MSMRLWLVLLLNGILMIAIAQRDVVLRDAWRSHNMARAAWEVLEKDQLKRAQEIFGQGFILAPNRLPPTNNPGP